MALRHTAVHHAKSHLKKAGRSPMTRAERLGMVFQKGWEGEVMDLGLWESRQTVGLGKLTVDQKKAVEAACVRRDNIFVGGGVGKGKTETLLHIKNILEGKGLRVGMYSMGMKKNPSLGSGETSFVFKLGLGVRPASPMYLCHGSPNQLMNCIRRTSPDFLSNYDVLILDDMEQADHDSWRSTRIALTNIDLVGVDHTYTGDPFGGIQIIAAGDFLAAEQGSFARLYAENHAFDDAAWERTFPVQIELENPSFVHETSYSAMLDRFRDGAPTQQDLDDLKKRVLPTPEPKKIGKTKTTQTSPVVQHDVLHGKNLVVPYIASRDVMPFMKYVGVHDPKGYLAPILKVENNVEGYRAYSVFFEMADTNSLKTQPAGMMSTGLKAMLSSQIKRHGLQVPTANAKTGIQGFLHPTTTQVFAPGEDVVLVESINNEGEVAVPAGSRGVVTSCEEDHIVVSFEEGTVKVYRVTIEVMMTPRSCALLKENQLEDGLEDTEFKSSYSWFPLTGVKIVSSSDLYATPFINGYTSQSGRICIDMEHFWTGSLRSLYPALAHAKSLADVEFTYPHTAEGHENPGYTSLFVDPPSHENYCYPPATLFHKKALPNLDVATLKCTVCKQPLSEPCPMSSDVEELLLEQRIRHCTNEYEHCETTGKTMTKAMFLVHSRDMAFVRCECGDLVRFKDLMEHREKYVKGTTCEGPQKGGEDEGQEVEN